MRWESSWKVEMELNVGDRGEYNDLVELSFEFFPSIEYLMFK